MKKIFFPALFFSALFVSCQKNNEVIEQASLAKTNENGRSICQTERPKTLTDCGKEFNPVCGCNSVTYANSCAAKNEGIQKWVIGTCESYGGGYPGDGVNQ